MPSTTALKAIQPPSGRGVGVGAGVGWGLGVAVAVGIRVGRTVAVGASGMREDVAVDIGREVAVDGKRAGVGPAHAAKTITVLHSVTQCTNSDGPRNDRTTAMGWGQLTVSPCRKVLSASLW